MNFLDPTTFGAPSNDAINQQGDRIAGILRKAASNAANPPMSSQLESLARMNQSGGVRMANAIMGNYPQESLGDVYDANMDRLRNQGIQNSRLEVSAEKAAYDQLVKAREMGDADADRIISMAEKIAGDNAFDLINAMEEDIPDEINADNFLKYAIPTAQKRGLIAKAKPKMSYKYDVEGNLVGINETEGTASVVPVGGVSGAMPSASAYAPSQTDEGLIMPPVPEIADPTAGMSPKARLEYNKRQIEMQTPKPPSGYRYNAAGALEAIPGGEEGGKRDKAMKLKDDTLRLVDEILADEDALRRAVGPISSMKPTLRGSTADIEAKIDQLKSILTSENLDLMTGVLSETDMKVIAAIAGGGITTKRGEEGFIKELKRLRATRTNEPQMPSVPQMGGDIDAELDAIDRELGLK